MVRENAALVCVHLCDRSEMAHQHCNTFCFTSTTNCHSVWLDKKDAEGDVEELVFSDDEVFVGENLNTTTFLTLEKEVPVFANYFTLASHTTKHICANI